MSKGIILVLVLIYIMIVINVILTRGMVRDTFQMNWRKKNYLLLMDM